MSSSFSPRSSSGAPLAALGADATRLAQLASLIDAGRVPGRVIRAERGSALVTTQDGTTAMRTTRRCSPAPAVGDWVVVDDAAVVDVLPRTSAVARADAAGRSVEQVLVANVDRLLVCVTLVPDARLRLLERLLALAWASGAVPLVVATKADLCPADQRSGALERLADAAPRAEVLAVSAYDDSAAAVRTLAGPGRTVALIGASGVGKSTLANVLLGTDALATGELRSDGKGRHTTAWRELVVLPGGGALVDTPGLRAVGLHAADFGVDRAFADVVELAEQCRFSDCGHQTEPGCAVLAALAAGELDPDRLASHQKLQRELAWQRAKTDARVRAERARAWKAIAKAQRARYRS